MSFLKELFSWNYILCVSVTGWLTAQILKTIINVVLTGRFQLERMWGSGGMPSSHSATVCALVVAAGKNVGTQSPIFAVCLILALIVMYDAMGVRRETGKQAKVLNRMITNWMEAESKHTPILADKKLKEMVGHTPFEVMGGCIVGLIVGFAIPVI